MRSAADPSEPRRQAKPAPRRDAAARPRETVLPGLEVHEVEAAAPHMALRLVVGSFGKGALCRSPSSTRPRRSGGPTASSRSSATSHGRRAGSRRAGCWSLPTRLARLLSKLSPVSRLGTSTPSPGSMPTAACACSWSSADRCRPMPRWRLAGALFRHLPAGGCGQTLRGVRMRDGSSRGCGSDAMPTTRPSCCAPRSATTRCCRRSGGGVASTAAGTTRSRCSCWPTSPCRSCMIRSSRGRRCNPTCSSACWPALPSTAPGRRGAASLAVLERRAGQEGVPAVGV